MREGAEREPLLVATVPSGWWGYLVDGLGLGVVRVEEANELGGAHLHVVSSAPGQWRARFTYQLSTWGPLVAMSI